MAKATGRDGAAPPPGLAMLFAAAEKGNGAPGISARPPAKIPFAEQGGARGGPPGLRSGNYNAAGGSAHSSGNTHSNHSNARGNRRKGRETEEHPQRGKGGRNNDKRERGASGAPIPDTTTSAPVPPPMTSGKPKPNKTDKTDKTDKTTDLRAGKTAISPDKLFGSDSASPATTTKPMEKIRYPMDLMYAIGKTAFCQRLPIKGIHRDVSIHAPPSPEKRAAKVERRGPPGFVLDEKPPEWRRGPDRNSDRGRSNDARADRDRFSRDDRGDRRAGDRYERHPSQTQRPGHTQRGDRYDDNVEPEWADEDGDEAFDFSTAVLERDMEPDKSADPTEKASSRKSDTDGSSALSGADMGFLQSLSGNSDKQKAPLKGKEREKEPERQPDIVDQMFADGDMNLPDLGGMSMSESRPTPTNAQRGGNADAKPASSGGRSRFGFEWEQDSAESVPDARSTMATGSGTAAGGGMGARTNSGRSRFGFQLEESAEDGVQQPPGGALLPDEHGWGAQHAQQSQTQQAPQPNQQQHQQNPQQQQPQLRGANAQVHALQQQRAALELQRQNILRQQLLQQRQITQRQMKHLEDKQKALQQQQQQQQQSGARPGAAVNPEQLFDMFSGPAPAGGGRGGSANAQQQHEQQQQMLQQQKLQYQMQMQWLQQQQAQAQARAQSQRPAGAYPQQLPPGASVGRGMTHSPMPAAPVAGGYYNTQNPNAPLRPHAIYSQQAHGAGRGQPMVSPSGANMNAFFSDQLAKMQQQRRQQQG